MSVYRVFGVLGILLAASAVASADLVSDSGLIVYYSYNNAANLGLDGSDNHFDGTVFSSSTGPATLAYAVDSVRGGVAQFSNSGGAATGYIDLPFASILAAHKSPTSNFTLAVWVKSQAATPQEVFSAFTDPSDSGVNNKICIHAELRPDQDPSNYRFVLREGGSAADIFDMNTKGTIAPVANEWHHVAMTYDETLTADQMKIYIDGDLKVSATPSADRLKDIAPWNVAARIGATADNYSRPYVGMMDEFYLFNRTLSTEEVGNIGLYGVVPEPGCLTLWLLGLVGGGYVLRKRRIRA